MLTICLLGWALGLLVGVSQNGSFTFQAVEGGSVSCNLLPGRPFVVDESSSIIKTNWPNPIW